MKRNVGIVMILVASGFLGWLVYHWTDSTTAAYIVSCVGTAAGVVGLLLALRQGRGIESSVKIKNAKNAEVTGVNYCGSSDPSAVKSDVGIGKVEGGNVTGVRLTRKK